MWEQTDGSYFTVITTSYSQIFSHGQQAVDSRRVVAKRVAVIAVFVPIENVQHAVSQARQDFRFLLDQSYAVHFRRINFRLKRTLILPSIAKEIRVNLPIIDQQVFCCCLLVCPSSLREY